MPTDDTGDEPATGHAESSGHVHDAGSHVHDAGGHADSGTYAAGIPDFRGHSHDESHGSGHSHGHSHGSSFDEPAPDDWWVRWKRVLLEWYHGLAHSMFEAHAFENIEKEAEDIEDAFLFACFADAFGIPSPVSYYTVELLPYLTDEFEQWERRMWDRDTLLERKGEQYHFH